MTDQLASATPGTLPLNLKIAGTSGLRPDLDGLRLTPPRGGPIYLMDRGVRRHIPNPATYNNLFRDWNGVISDVDVDIIPEGPPLLDGAILFRPDGRPEVYMIDDAGKRHVVSPEAMDKYYFNWNTIVQVPEVITRFVPDSDPLS